MSNRQRSSFFADTVWLPPADPKDRRRAKVPIGVEHRTRSNLTALFGFLGAVESGGPIEHTFEMYVTDDVVTGLSKRAYAAIEALAAHAPVGAELPSPPDPERIPLLLLLARLTVGEYPEAWVGLGGRNWYDAFDGAELEVLAEFMEVVEEAEAGGSMALIDGSAFVYRYLHVHPAVRGQDVGLRLLTHAVLALHRSVGDVSLLVVNPVRSLWEWGPKLPHEMEPRRCTPEAVQALVRYYGRAGFECCRRDEDARLYPEDPSRVMHRRGEWPLPRYRDVRKLFR